MLDIFKRNQEGQPPEEPQAPEEPEVPVQMQEAAETPEVPQEPKAAEETEGKVEENLTTVLETLKQEENSLLNQKQQLMSIGEQLRLRTLGNREDQTKYQQSENRDT